MIFTSYTNDFCHNRKIDNFDPYNLFLDIATNITVLLMTGFVVQGHIFCWYTFSGSFKNFFFIITDPKLLGKRNC